MSDELTPTEQSYIDTKGATPLEAPQAPAEAAPAAPAPEAKPAEKAPDEPRTVPLAVFLQTRDEAKEAKRAAEELRAWKEKIEAKFNAPEPVIDPEADPVAALKALTGEFERLKGETAAERKQREDADQQNKTFQALTAHVTADEQRFAAVQPDYWDAVKFVASEREAELTELGFPPEARRNILVYEAQGIAFRAANDGVSMAERVYKMAQRRGYKAKAAEKAEKQPDLATIAAGQKAAGTLSGSGSVTPPDMSLEAVANMSTDEFEAWMSEGKNAKRWEQMKRGLA